MKTPFWVLFSMLSALTAQACIWDAETLFQEKMRSHDLAETILGNPPAPENPQKLQERIKTLEASRDENNPEWWNNLAGAYMRLGQPEAAVKLLEPVVSKFPNEYGIHANLGTAYHLLGRYAEAEKEIARDLEINPDAHFGLEKYHLALLQYLMRDDKYKSRHLYVDEFTSSFFQAYHGRFYFRDADDLKTEAQLVYTNGISEAEKDYESTKRDHSGKYDYEVIKTLGMVAALDASPGYRTNWDFASNTNFEAGAIYMAQMNPKEPACFEMLGVVAWKKHNYHLAVSAFQKAIALGSLKSDLLVFQIAGLNDYIDNSFKNKIGPDIAAFLILVLIPFLILYYVYTKIRDQRRKLKAT